MIYNGKLADELQEYASFPADWLERAFKEAADANARNWRYVRACLDSWKRAGRITEKKGTKPAATPAPSNIPDMDDFDKMYGYA